MWKILQNRVPGDYVAAAGETHTVREFAELAFQNVGIDILERKNINEKVFARIQRKYLLKLIKNTLDLLK